MLQINKAQENMIGYTEGNTGTKQQAVAEPEDASRIQALQYRPEKSQSAMAKTAVDGFEEYKKDLQEKAKEQGKSIEEQQRQEKEEQKEIARTLTKEEIDQLRMLGFDVGSASLSDLMDMVNTLRGKAHREEVAQMLAQAQFSSQDTKGVTLIAGQVQTADDQMEIENVQSPSMTVGNQEILYLMRTGKEPTKENLYMAHFSGQKVEDENLQSVYQDMEPQFARVIVQAGLDVNEESMQAAKLLLHNHLPVTTDSLRQYMTYSQAIGTDGTAMLEEKDTKQAAQNLYDAVISISDVDVNMAVKQERPLSIASLLALHKGQPVNPYTREQADLEAVCAMRQMEEIRYAMTQQVASRMIRMDINIDTRELSQVVACLRETEQQLMQEAFARHEVEMTPENVQLYQQVQKDVERIEQAPAANLANVLSQTSFTVRDFAQSIRTDSEIWNYEQPWNTRENMGSVGRNRSRFLQTFEALKTAPRRDMGDSMNQAFRNVEAMLGEMDVEVTAETIRAVKILGYNSMEITPESVDAIVGYDRVVNDMIDAFHPEAVLDLIKEGINPMDLPIDELNEALRNRVGQEHVRATDDFATFLRDVERRGEITEEERSSYIGLYRMAHQLAKSGDREVGYLYANGSRLTIRNLLQAMRSKKATGLDVAIDDAFGMTETVEESGVRIDTQISAAFSKLTPQAEQFMEAYGIANSAVNVEAVMHLLDQNESFYQLVTDWMQKLRIVDHTKEDSIDEETQHMSESMSGKQVPLSFELESILEHLQSAQEMSKLYEDLQEEVTQRMYESAAIGRINSTDCIGIKTIQAGFSILHSLAKQNRYQLPVRTEDGVQIVNLTIQQDEAKRGTMELSVHNRQFGELAANLSVDYEGRLTGEVLAQTSEGGVAVSLAKDRCVAMLAQEGYDASAVSFGTRNPMASNEQRNQEGLTDRQIYKAAVVCVKALAQLSDIVDR